MASSFAVEEKVLIHHKGMIYGAKVLGRKVRDGAAVYLAHYNGWNKKWDEWVAPERILKLNEENIAEQRRLNAAVTAAERKKKEEAALKKQAALDAKLEKRAGNASNKRRRTAPTAGPSQSQQPPPGKADVVKLGAASALPAPAPSASTTTAATTTTTTTPDDAQGPVKPAPRLRGPIKIEIPELLQTQLIDDQEFIRTNNLVPLPRKPSVAQLLRSFKSHAQDNGIPLAIVGPYVAQMKLFFCVAVGHQLLYPFERAQYADLLEVEKVKPMQLCNFYGAEHLLRLFVRLPAWLSETSTTLNDLDAQLNCAAALLEFLKDNFSEVFVDNYANASQEYIRLAHFAGL